MTGTDGTGDVPTIVGGRCLACDHLFAPAQHYGCERCGEQRIETIALPAIGRVVSVATVNVHRYPVPKTPFVIMEVALDAGPIIRVLGHELLAIGSRTSRGADGEDGSPRFVAVGHEVPA